MTDRMVEISKAQTSITWCLLRSSFCTSIQAEQSTSTSYSRTACSTTDEKRANVSLLVSEVSRRKAPYTMRRAPWQSSRRARLWCSSSSRRPASLQGRYRLAILTETSHSCTGNGRQTENDDHRVCIVGDIRSEIRGV